VLAVIAQAEHTQACISQSDEMLQLLGRVELAKRNIAAI
jgi:hypothetical protein